MFPKSIMGKKKQTIHPSRLFLPLHDDLQSSPSQVMPKSQTNHPNQNHICLILKLDWFKGKTTGASYTVGPSSCNLLYKPHYLIMSYSHFRIINHGDIGVIPSGNPMKSSISRIFHCQPRLITRGQTNVAIVNGGPPGEFVPAWCTKPCRGGPTEPTSGAARGAPAEWNFCWIEVRISLPHCIGISHRISLRYDLDIEYHLTKVYIIWILNIVRIELWFGDYWDIQ